MYEDDLVASMGGSASCTDCELLLPHINAALAAWEMQTPLRTAAFLAVASVSSDGFRY